MSDVSQWLAEGARVVERVGGKYIPTTVKRVTATLVVLTNGSKYHRGGSQLVKVGEKNKTWYGANGPTWLLPVDAAVREQSQGIVRAAADGASRAAFQVTQRGGEPRVALDAMQAEIDKAREGLARLWAEYNA